MAPGTANPGISAGSNANAGTNNADANSAQGRGANRGGGNGGASREGRGGNSTPIRYGGTPFNSGSSSSNSSNRIATLDKKPGALAGGDLTPITGGYGDGSGGRRSQNRIKLDQRFSFTDEERERQKRDEPIMVSRAPTDLIGSNTRIKLLARQKRSTEGVEASTSLTFADFLRYLIIAAIVIALVLFIGGQLLQIGKNME